MNAIINPPPTILIVDDESKNRKLLEVLLRPEGYRTLSAANGDEVMISIAQDLPDLILLDIMMPGVDGYQVASQLKANPDTANIPIIMVTARTDRNARLTSLKAGAEEFLTKPVDRVELSLRVRNLLRLKTIGDLQSRSQHLEQQVMERTADLQHSNAVQLAEAARQKTVLNALPVQIALLDHEGNIIFVNEAWRHFAGMNAMQMANDALGTNYLKICDNARGQDSDEAAEVARGTRSVLSGQSGNFTLEYPCHSPANKRWFRMTVTPLSNAPKSGVIVMHLDITARKEAEEEIYSLNIELEERVRQRTAQLLVANEELAAFSYSVSHDLRAPLSAINGFSRLLDKEISKGVVTARTRHFLSRIDTGVVQMGELIDAMLLLAQLSRTALRWENVDLSALAGHIFELFREREPARLMQFDIQPDMLAEGDPRLLRQVLENLLGNALKFSARQTESRISFACAVGKDGESVYSMQDNGAGFDMAYVEKLFGAFQRLHSATEFAGTGIGLATVHRIVSRHGGRVWAESAPGQGACFHFTLGQRGSGG